MGDKFLTKRFLDKFMSEKCDGEDNPECLEKFRTVFLSLVRKRYPFAKKEDIDARCESVPAECEYLAMLELLYLKSHNAALVEQLKSRLGELDDQESSARQAAQKSADERREGDARRQRFANAVAAFGAGLAGSDQPSGAAVQPYGVGSCSSDYQCPMGHVCAKDSNAMTGVCARSVNQYGTPTYAPPSSDSVGPGKGNCSYDTECALGFRCVKTSGGLRGNCMK